MLWLLPEAAEEHRGFAAGTKAWRILGVDLEQFGKIKDLQTVVPRFGPNVGLGFDDLDISPSGGFRLGWEAADALRAAVFEDLYKSRTTGLSENSTLASIGGSPTQICLVSRLKIDRVVAMKLMAFPRRRLPWRARL